MSLSVERQRGELPERGGSPAWVTLAAWIALCLAAGGVGAIASSGSRELYASLERSQWAPPAGAFGPVWTVLYLLMGISAWLVWRERPAEGTPAAAARRTGVALFVVQLALNALWTWLFFHWRQGSWALAEILVLWVAIAVTTFLFARVRRLAALLLLPYLGWVSFAAALTLDVWRRNPGLL